MTNIADVILTFCFLKLKFGPVVQTPPYSEGEFYSVLERNVSFQVRESEEQYPPASTGSLAGC